MLSIISIINKTHEHNVMKRNVMFLNKKVSMAMEVPKISVISYPLNFLQCSCIKICIFHTASNHILVLMCKYSGNSHALKYMLMEANDNVSLCQHPECLRRSCNKEQRVITVCYWNGYCFTQINSFQQKNRLYDAGDRTDDARDRMNQLNLTHKQKPQKIYSTYICFSIYFLYINIFYIFYIFKNDIFTLCQNI